MNTKKNSFPALLLALGVAASVSPENFTQADTRILPFQGRLSDANGNAVPDGARVVQFKIYDAPVGGRAVWNGEVQNLTINAGLVSTLLGTKASLSGVDFNQDLYLEITIDANGDGQISLADPPLLPRQSILPAVFSRESANSRLLDGYDWSALFGTNNPADGTLLASKIGDKSVATAKLADAAVTGVNIANGAVALSKLDPGGASAGQSVVYNGSNVVWSSVNAVDAAHLNGFDWTALFDNGNPQTGILSAATLISRGSLYSSDLTVSGRSFLNGPTTTIQGTLFVVAIGGAPRMDGNLWLNDNGLYLRGVGDFNHFLKWENGYGGNNGFDGPLLVGNVGGLLGAGGNWALRWNSNGSVQTRGAISSGSDRNMKENFARVDSSEVLSKVLELPITRWNYRDDPTTPHLGPVAQDFHAAFRVGSDDKSIAVVDADGVALAAIQGLHHEFKESESDIRKRLAAQEQQIEALKAEIATLKSALR